MPKKISIHLFLIIVLFALLVGCTSSTQPLPASVPPAKTFVTTQNATLPLVIPTLVPTLALTNTFTSIPTLSPEDAHTRLRALLNDSTSCRLPCWLGITPGQSTWQDANEQLALFSGIADSLYIKAGADEWSTRIPHNSKF